MRCALTVVILLELMAGTAAVAAPSATDILTAANAKAGLLVHLGCGDGQLTVALAENDRFVVQGLDRDPSNVEAARDRAGSLDVYGKLSIDRWIGDQLPYVDNLVNVLVVGQTSPVDRDEILRVLVPGGVAIFAGQKNADGSLQRLVKPWPAQIDQWTHYLHGPDNNAVAQDTEVGPPQSLQWVDGPPYARSHEINSSMGAMVSGGGRLFYIWDEGPTAITDKRFPPRWSLIAKNAFNGLLLWKRPMPQWGWRQWHAPTRWDDPLERAKMLRHLPPTLPRRLVVAEQRLYVTLGYEAPVSELDVATGRTLREFEQTAWTDEILHVDGRLLLRVRVADSPPDKDMWSSLPEKQRGHVMAVDLAEGRTVWQSQAEAIAPLTLATSGGRVFYSNYDQVVCLDGNDGRELWRSQELDSRKGHRGTAGTLVAQEKVVLYAHTPRRGGSYFGQLNCFSAETGELLWSGPKYAGPGPANPPDLFVINDLVWIGETRLPVDVFETELRREGFDLLSGVAKREVVVPKLISPGHHYRCYRSKATERYLLLPKRGVEFVDLEERNHMRNDWLRAPCTYGVLPANGLLYVAPHQCVCYPGVQLANFNALTARRPSPPEPADDAERLHRGPAWKEPASDVRVARGDWPAYRRDARRSGSIETTVPAAPNEKWRCQLQGELTPPVVAGGRVLVAEKDAHALHALDLASGKSLWRFTVGGRIDSPPTVHGSLILFGSADGHVYCLRLDDGKEVWRFLAAPSDRRISAFGQIESAWPVHGSVLVTNDITADPPRPVVYCTAGRSSFLDGGIRVYGLDPHTGAVLHETCLDGPHPDPFKDVGGAGYMDGAKSDLLVSDGSDIYLYQERFRTDLKRFPSPMQKLGKEGGGFRIFPAFPERRSSGRRLITTSGFLDDAYNEGTYWTYSERWAGWDRKMGSVPCYGQLLVFNDAAVYGVHVFTENVRVRRGHTLGERGYRLFARPLEASKDQWSVFVPIRVRAMVLAGDTLFVAGMPDEVPEQDPLAAIEGRRGARLLAISAKDGKKLKESQQLNAPPVFDGLIAAHDRLLLCTTDGAVLCLGR